ncbi:MAG: FAD-binding oxidoreductase [Candidatus Bathyarchaeota archaeon]|nr:MAG: FAD-binding oxidoreductase [Candidatus Bathyarchaeota archaeon]
MGEYDAIIVGAGVLGLSTAFHISYVCPKAKILVIEQNPRVGQGNSAKSASMFRTFFSTEVGQTLARSSIDFYEHVHEKIVDLKMKWTGYLWLFCEEDFKDFRSTLNEMERKGLEYMIYDKDELEKKLDIKTRISDEEEAKFMGLSDVDLGVFAPKAGAMDVDALVKFYESRFTQRKGKIRFNLKVKNIIIEPCEPLGTTRFSGEPFFWQEARVAGVNTTQGVIKAKKTIIAAGAWAPSLLDQVGVTAHLKPRKRQIFSVTTESRRLRELYWTRGFNQEGCVPLTFLPRISRTSTRISFSPHDGNAFWLFFSDKFPRAFKHEENPQPENYNYTYGLYPILTKYFPQFNECKASLSWAGECVYTPDLQPIALEQNDLIFVGGTSGNGIMKADSLGRIVAALFAGDEHATLYGDKKFRVSDLSIEKRNVEPERVKI